MAITIMHQGADALLGAPAPTPTERAVTPTVTLMPSATPVPPSPTFTPTPTPTASPTPTPSATGPAAYEDWALARYGPPWTVDCENEDTADGYNQGAWARDFCVPGHITYDAYRYNGPRDFFGLMSSYAEGVMEAQVKHRGLPEGTHGVALMSCEDIGQKVWLRVPGESWQGPFVAVDCSGRNHMYYHHVGMGLAVEVGYEDTGRFGARVLPRVDVHIGPGKPGGWSGGYLAYWWVENALRWEGVPTPVPSATTEPPEVLD